MEMPSVNSCASMCPYRQKAFQSVPQVPGGRSAAQDAPKTQREMTLKVVSDQSGAYDNARIV